MKTEVVLGVTGQHKEFHSRKYPGRTANTECLTYELYVDDKLVTSACNWNDWCFEYESDKEEADRIAEYIAGELKKRGIREFSVRNESRNMAQNHYGMALIDYPDKLPIDKANEIHVERFTKTLEQRLAN